MDIFARDADFPDNGPSIVGVSLSLMLVGVILVAIRTLHRVKTHTFGWDDAFIIVAVVLSMGHSIVDGISVYTWGYGRHKENLTPAQISAPGQNLGFWIAQIIYKSSIPCTKLSICLLYRRLFERAGRVFNIALYTLMGLIAAYYSAAVLTTIFECTPIAKAYEKSLPGHCIDSGTFFFTNAGFNIATDVAIMVLPIPVIKSLHLPNRQKVILSLVFAVGLLATATSIYRLFTLNLSAQAEDPTWVVGPGVLWSATEMNVAIICACLPVLKGPLQTLFPRLFASSNRSYTYGSSQRYGNGLRSNDSRFKRFSRHPDLVAMDTIDKRLGAHAFKIDGKDDSKSEDEVTILGASGEGLSNGILKSMDFKITYDDTENEIKSLPRFPKETNI